MIKTSTFVGKCICILMLFDSVIVKYTLREKETEKIGMVVERVMHFAGCHASFMPCEWSAESRDLMLLFICSDKYKQIFSVTNI